MTHSIGSRIASLLVVTFFMMGKIEVPLFIGSRIPSNIIVGWGWWWLLKTLGFSGF